MTSHPTRRAFLKATGAGFGALALRDLLAADAGRVPQPHHVAKADAVIFLFMYGGPSQVDTFDYKPDLEKWAGKAIPAFKKGDGFFDHETKPTAFPSPYSFQQCGESGLWVSVFSVRQRPCSTTGHGWRNAGWPQDLLLKRNLKPFCRSPGGLLRGGRISATPSARSST